MTSSRTDLESQMMAAEPRPPRRAMWTWVVVRLLVGSAFLWSFLDRLYGLGVPTPAAEGWIDGGSPTASTLWYDLRGPLADPVRAITGARVIRGPSSFERYSVVTRLVEPHAWVDWVFMLSMLIIGMALVLGVLTRICAVGGMVWMAVIQAVTALWATSSLLVALHVLTFLLLGGIAIVGHAGHPGPGVMWQRLRFVRTHHLLE